MLQTSWLGSYMKAADLIRLAKKYPRWLLSVLTMAACAWALIQWFFLGLLASKWIGLPQYASAMQKQEQLSRSWGIAGAVLEVVALVLAFFAERQPSIPAPAAHASLTYPFEQNRWMHLVRYWFIRMALVVLGTVGFILLFLVIIYFVGAIIYRFGAQR